MMKGLLKGFQTAVTILAMDRYRRLSVGLVKIEFATAYVRGVQMARCSAVGFLWMGLVIAFMGVGALLAHVGLFILLPWTMQTKAIIGLLLGLAYVILGGVVLLKAMSERAWLEKSGANCLLNAAVK